MPEPQMRTLEFAHARPDEVLAVRKAGGILWLPVGPLEWHGPHLPFGTDALNATNTALACAARVGGLVLPTLYCGTERERAPAMLADLGLDPASYVVGMDFPAHSLASGYFPEEEFALQIRGWIDRASAWKFRVLVIVNGHGAQNHNSVLERFVQSARSGALGLDVLAFLSLVAEPAGSLNVGHATMDETSLMLLDYPEDVLVSALPSLPRPLPSREFGLVDDPTFRGRPLPDHTLRPEDDPRRGACAALGSVMRERTVAYICGRVEEFTAGRGTVRSNLSAQL